jgi:hypothetical protein
MREPIRSLLEAVRHITRENQTREPMQTLLETTLCTPHGGFCQNARRHVDTHLEYTYPFIMT